MSSGVSDQMKAPGNTAKNAEERNIPWSQQVDEASYENLASPATDDNSAAHQNSMQFQYPPFNAKENQDASWNNSKSRKTTSGFDTSKKHGKPAFYSNTKRDDFQPNAWVAHNSRKIISDNPGNFNRSNRSDDAYLSGKLDNRPTVNAPTEEKKVTAQAVVAAPKKTTWASIASQPAKLTSRTTLPTSSHKKKGPGMPPPPMVPGKHNLDVNTWDLPNNNPPPVPSPPPPIEQTYDTNPEFSATIVPDYDLGARSEKGHKGSDREFPKEENNKSNYSSFGRTRTSPNGHSRKNWSTQHPLQQSRQGAGGIAAAPIRRSEGNGPQIRFGDRKPNYSNSRTDQDTASYDFRDENTPRNVGQCSSVEELPAESQAVLEELRDKNNYNPADIDLEKATMARFFVIKSYSEDDIHRSIKYEIWCSTDHGNKRLDDAFKERHKEGGNILLFFSVNGSGHFCGMAQMMTAVDYNSTASVWSQDKWKGKFKVKWIYVKDVPNTKLRHIRLENNDNKSVTNSRDTQEVPNAKGIEVLQILHSYKHSTSIFDDFYHYEKKQEEEVSSKKPPMHDSMTMLRTHSPMSRHYPRQNDDRDRDRDRDRDGRGSGSGGAQKYFGGGNGAGGSGSNFRDRNSLHRGGYHNNYNEHRRFESHRTAAMPDYQQKDRDERVDVDRDRGERERENSEYGSRHTQKFDYNQRTQSKHNRERDFSEEHSKGDIRFRSGAREMQKDNEYPSNADRVRGIDY